MGGPSCSISIRMPVAPALISVAVVAFLQPAQAVPAAEVHPAYTVKQEYPTPPPEYPVEKPVYTEKADESQPGWAGSLDRAQKVLVVDSQIGQDYGSDAYLDLVKGIQNARAKIVSFVNEDKDKAPKAAPPPKPKY